MTFVQESKNETAVSAEPLENRSTSIPSFDNSKRELLQEAKLYDIPEASMSSSERARRHGEKNHLRDLRKEAVMNEKKSRKRKLGNEPMEDDENDDFLDVKDIDFRLAQDGGPIEIFF